MDGKGASRRVPRSEPICPSDFLKSWSADVLEATQMEPSTESQILHNLASKMLVSEETVKELAEVCGKSTLYQGNEPKTKVAMLKMSEAPPDVDLECVKYQMEHKKRRQENDSLKIHISRHLKYNSLDDYLAVVIPNTALRQNTEEEFKVSQPNVVLTVQVTKCLMQGDISQMIREKETFLVLGHQKLTELRDKIRCSSDVVIPGEHSSMPDFDPDILPRAGDIYKSSYFFIENVFYNDMRIPENKDYSEPVILWASECTPKTFMTKANMAETSFFDLTIRLGHHYLFMHQGNCEHSVLFTDMRLFNASDLQDVRMYPLPYITRTRHRIVCQGCCKLSARWIVRDSPLIPTDPCYLCRLCFKTLLYTKQGMKISNFRAQHL
uniref:snRNA-activating protein complex subunit 3 n=1 Tax=Arion vulgaris TaxID=1028688 RepID=A0A0B6ZLB7_9EUPU